MSFSVHTFEINPDGNNLGFAFHETIGEGREIYFLGKFQVDTIDASAIAEELFGTVVDSLTKNSESDQYEAFEQALKGANNVVKRLKQKMPSDPEIVIAYFDFHHLYLTQSGGAESYLIREDSLSQISEPSTDEDVLFSNVLIGNVSVQDVLVFSNTRLLRTVTNTQFSDIFQQASFDDAVAQLRHSLMSASEEDMLVTVIGIGKKSTSGPAAFLSKMVSKVTPDKNVRGTVLASEKDAVSTETEIEDSAEADVLETTEDATEERLDLAEESASTETKDVWLDSFNLLQTTVKRWLGKISLEQWKKLIIGGAAVLLLFVGIRFIMNYESEADAALRAELQVARQSLSEADTLLIQGDREQAAVLIEKARKSAQNVLSSKTKTFRFDAQTVLKDVQEKQLSVENARKVNPEILADLSLKNDKVSALGILPLQNNSYVYDSRRIYKTVRDIVERGLKISDSESIIAGAVRSGQKVLTFLSDAPRVIEMRGGVISPMSTADETWKTGIDLKNFGARYLYVLDPVSNQIWKYTRKSSSYSGATAYSSGVDLSRAISMAIDGAIYVLSDDGKIQKLFRGNKVEYGFRNLPSIPFSGKNLKLYTTANQDYLYVLDPANTRILVFDKGERFATYKKQVLFESVANVRDFFVDDDEQKATIVTDQKLYEFGL
ncbi:hypothetical protein CSB37_01830 [bacterium DOLZORAL124_38_8]|nr:MAG: hypothetical protein CSB37_01830 [bacterium DOLZORAL124_38_8]